MFNTICTVGYKLYWIKQCVLVTFLL